jgi:cysteine desulfurase
MVHGRRIVRIYLDFNATAPPAPGVVEAVASRMTDVPGNASSVHAFGQQAKAELDAARSALAALIGADASEIVFTSGGTEADNFAIRGAAAVMEPAGRRHIVATGLEHEAVLQPLKDLERRGHPITRLSTGPSGVLARDALADALTPATALVSIMLANNEVGTIQPVADLAALARANGTLVHTDAVQAVGRIPVDVKRLGVDLLSLSGHKFGGPKGTGALWIRRGVRLAPLLLGGRQERNRRAGTENVPALAGLGVAARHAATMLDATAPAIAALRDELERRVLETVPGTAVNGDRDRRVPNTTNISFDGIEAESLLIALDLEGVAVSTGSACSSGTLEPSHVLSAMGLPSPRTRNSIRFSLGPTTTADEIAFVASVLPGLVEKLRRLSRTAAGLR